MNARRQMVWLYYMVLFLSSGCQTVTQSVETTTTPFTRDAMLGNIVQTVILPDHATFVAETAALERATLALADAPAPATLETAREQWRQTAAAWKRIELYNFRNTMTVHSSIHRWPVNIAKIESVIASNEEPLSAEIIDNSGSNVKGLATIEYLLFTQEDTLITSVQPRRMDYLTMTATSLHRTANQLQSVWTISENDYATTFIAANGDGSDIRGSVNLLANQMVAMTEGMVKDQIGKPAGMLNDFTPNPEMAEAWRSQNSIPLMIANLQGIERAFSGADGLGYDDYLDSVDAQYNGQPLSQAFKDQIAHVIDTLERIDGPLAEAVLRDDRSAIKAAQDAAQQLLILVKVDMANHLGVTIVFSDNDGD